jgi:peptidoglycan/LPS O-acetylase OafA/YrhL
MSMMNPVSPVFAVLGLLLAFAVAFALSRLAPVRFPEGRVSTIDGLRGYLGFAVFLHHAAIWFFYLRTGEWALPPSRLYTHLGQSGVALFFMITGFLFYARLLQAGGQPTHWTRLYVGRFFRLAPLYGVTLAGLLVVVAVLSNGALAQSWPALALDVGRWLGFTILGSPDLNGVARTSLILASVTWTLPYEWLFYGLLPLLALTTGARPAVRLWPWLLLGIAALALAAPLGLSWRFLVAFAGGMAAAVLQRISAVRAAASSPWASTVVLVCAALVVGRYDTAYSAAPLVLLTLAFSLVASGASVFGLFTRTTSRLLGELTYGIYLLHGLLLFVLFRFVIGFEAAAQLSPPAYWAAVLACVPLLLGTTWLTFRFVEQPGIAWGRRLAGRIG